MQGQFITCLCHDLSGRIWVGTEDGQGLWSYDPAAKAWTHFPASPDLSGDIYALTCDKAGRIWAGGLSGVSVYNGKTWRQYDPTDGPLGSRLFALAVDPKDGGVWGATEAGLFRYDHSHWTYFTRVDGLPSNQANALAFDADGTLYVGTQCDGIVIASPADNYKTWHVVPGPATLPNAPSGTGLPSALINCLLVMPSRGQGRFLMASVYKRRHPLSTASRR
jgi:ligand-binding sensor domain-containing protein